MLCVLLVTLVLDCHFSLVVFGVLDRLQFVLGIVVGLVHVDIVAVFLELFLLELFVFKRIFDLFLVVVENHLSVGGNISIDGFHLAEYLCLGGALV